MKKKSKEIKPDFEGLYFMIAKFGMWDAESAWRMFAVSNYSNSRREHGAMYA